MKLGTVAIVYLLLVVLAANHRLVNLMMYFGLALALTVVITLVGLFFHSDHTVTFGARWSKRLITVLIFALVAQLTWRAIFGIIF